jgi:hypothetical protein
MLAHTLFAAGSFIQLSELTTRCGTSGWSFLADLNYSVFVTNSFFACLIYRDGDTNLIFLFIMSAHTISAAGSFIKLCEFAIGGRTSGWCFLGDFNFSMFVTNGFFACFLDWDAGSNLINLSFIFARRWAVSAAGCLIQQ